MHSYANPALTFLMRAVTVMGMQIVILPATAMAAIFLFMKGDRDGAWLILVAVAGAEVIEITMKVQFHRQRPEPFFDTILPGPTAFRADTPCILSVPSA